MATQLSPGQTAKGYQVEKLLNVGAMAIAYKAVDPSGQTVFLKQYKSPSCRTVWYPDYVKYQKEMKRRIESGPLQNLTYRFIDFFESKDSGQRAFYQVFEFVTGGRDLKEHLDDPAMTWNQRVVFAKLLMASMRNLHDADIIHCDLKPENLYLIPDSTIGTGFRFKVIDFDFSIFSDKTAPWDGEIGYAGTPGYLSPEHLAGQVPLEVSDVFTCGLILYELLSRGGHPYRTDDEEEYSDMIARHRAKKPVFIETLGSPEADDAVGTMIRECLNPDPNLRPTAADVHQILKEVTVRRSVSLPCPSPAPSAPSRSAPLPRPPSSSAPLPPPTPVPEPAPSRFVPEPGSSGLILTGENGNSVNVNLETKVGKAFMSRFGEDARFYSDVQYTLSREGAEWSAEPDSSAVNSTIYNGRTLTDKVVLHDGDQLAVGNEAKGIIKLPLIVKKR